MASERLRDVEEYMRLPYRMEIYWDDAYWAAEFPDLPGLAAGHETWEGLQAAIEDAKRAYFEAALESARPIPEPSVLEEHFSGQLRVRMPRSLHRDAARAAEREGVSLNSFITTAIAKELGRPTQAWPAMGEVPETNLAWFGRPRRYGTFAGRSHPSPVTEFVINQLDAGIRIGRAEEVSTVGSKE